MLLIYVLKLSQIAQTYPRKNNNCISKKNVMIKLWIETKLFRSFSQLAYSNYYCISIISLLHSVFCSQKIATSFKYPLTGYFSEVFSYSDILFFFCSCDFRLQKCRKVFPLHHKYKCLTYLNVYFVFSSSKIKKNTQNRTHTNVRYNKLSTDASSKSNCRRTTTLAVSADDIYAEPMLAYSDDDDDKEDDTTTFNINESRTDRISFYTNT